MAIPRVLCRVQLFLNNEYTFITKYPRIISIMQTNKDVPVRKVTEGCARFSSCQRLARHAERRRPVECSIRQSSSSSSSDSDTSDDEDEVIVEYHHGLPHITVPLPSRRERCRFTLKPISNRVGDFLEMLKQEDKGIDTALCRDLDGTRIAQATTVHQLLEEDFQLIVNDCTYTVKVPKEGRIADEEIKKLGDVKLLVSELYEKLHVKEHQIHKELEINQELENLRQQLLPLEQKRQEIEMAAQKRSNWMSWAGLGLMSVQFGILARLTWWEYSWDIMEPVTYFVTYGTAMAAYAYFVLTREEYILADVRNRQQMISLHKKARKLGLDLNQYNVLKNQMITAESTLHKLRDPITMRLLGQTAATPPSTPSEPPANSSEPPGKPPSDSAQPGAIEPKSVAQALTGSFAKISKA